jgi:hypothetical protein
MKQFVTIILTVLFCLTIMASFSQAGTLHRTYVNATCNSDGNGYEYTCADCHIDFKGGGPLTSDGQGFLDSGLNYCYFCPEVCDGNCTDADNDNYFAEAYCGTGVDCNDSDPNINEGAIEVCDDGIDNDCDNTIDCADLECNSECGAIGPENCVDGFDNDGDRKVDCADRDCRLDPICTSDGETGGSEGKGKTCSDGQDNDSDGAIDCDDSDCSSSKACK